MVKNSCKSAQFVAKNYTFAIQTQNLKSIMTLRTNSTYYIHTDHLGSYAMCDERYAVNGCHDARGRQCRQAVQTRPCGGIPADLTFLLLFWSSKKVEEENMNGRLYDPVIGRFFSPDNYVQDMEGTQSFNRYSYCLNNPLKYTDPTGQLVSNNFHNSTPWNRLFGCDNPNDNDSGNFDFGDGGDIGGGGGGSGSDPGKGSNPNPNWNVMPGIRIDYMYGKWDFERLREYFTERDIKSSLLDEVVVTADRPVVPRPPIPLGTGSARNNDWTLDIGTSFNNFGSALGKGMQKTGGPPRATPLPNRYSNYPKNVVKNMNAYANLTKVGSKLANGTLAVNLTLGGYDILTGMYEDGWTFGDNAQIATGRFAVGFGSAWLGAKMGFMIGAPFGCALPGSLLGAVVVGFIGAEAAEEAIRYFKP